VLDAVLSWAMFAYGFFAAVVEPVWHQDEVQIAVGGEMIVLALIGFPATKRGGTDAANRQAVPVAPAADLEGAVDRGEDVIVDAFRDTADR